MGMNKINWVYRLKVTIAMLTNAFNWVRDRFRQISSDLEHHGVLMNLYDPAKVNQQLLVTANGSPDMQVQVQPGVAVTREGVRVYRPSTAVDLLNCALDKNGASTIPSSGNERYISIYIVPKFDENQSGQPSPSDGHGNPYNLNHIVGHKFEVEAGAEASVGNAVIPTGRTDAVLLATVLLLEGTTTIANSATPYASGHTAGQISYFFRQAWDVSAAYYGRIFSARDHIDVRRNLGTSSNPAGSRLYGENFLRAFANVVGSSGAVAGNGKYNIVSVTRNATGQYTIALPTGFFDSVNDIIPMVTTRDSSGDLEPNEARAWASDANTIKVDIVGDVSSSWARKDVNFSLAVFGRISDDQLSSHH